MQPEAEDRSRRIRGIAAPPILLVGLSDTLVANLPEVASYARRAKSGGMREAISQVEDYHSWLIDWLGETPWDVHLLTARDAKHRIDTLASIESKTGWRPRAAWFNNTGTSPADPVKVKSQLFQRLLKLHSPPSFHAFSNNDGTRMMLLAHGVDTAAIREPADLDRIDQLWDARPVLAPSQQSLF